MYSGDRTEYITILVFRSLFEGGVFVFQLMDFYSASGMPLLWICFWETVALSWVFGAARFRTAIYDMTGHLPPYMFYLCWKYLGPAVMMGVFMFYLVSYSPVTYGDYQYPAWAEGIGLCLSLASMIWVPIYAVYYLCCKQVTSSNSSVSSIVQCLEWIFCKEIEGRTNTNDRC